MHAVRSDAFAGVERYVCTVANELSRRGLPLHVIGGDPVRMRAELDEAVSYTPGRSVGQVWRALAGIGRVRVVHAHMTAAETAAVASRMFHRAPVVSTRHFPDPRGRSALGRLVSKRVSCALARQIAISEFVAGSIDESTVVVRNGVAHRPQADLSAPRVLMMQRLEMEKAPAIGLRAWAQSGLAAHGWHLALAGSGRLAAEIDRISTELGVGDSVRRLGHVEDTDALLCTTSILLAPAPAEPFGLAVVEAMAHGIPVVAAGGGAHLETVGDDGMLFKPGDANGAAAHLLRLASDESLRRKVGAQLRARQRRLFSLEIHCDVLEQLYESVSPADGQLMPRPTVDTNLMTTSDPRAPTAGASAALRELVVCSLEPWDEVWRRNQFFVDALLKSNPRLRVLFVEPPADVLNDLRESRLGSLPRFRKMSYGGRLWAFRPLKPLPRRLGPLADATLLAQVRAAAGALRFSRPVLWINDVTYAPLIRSTGWPSLYDVTDDWLLAPAPPRERERLRRLDELALTNADEVVVCSPALAASRGETRPVTVVPNGVDVEHFRRARPRPVDLPKAPTAVYLGTLHDARIDVELVIELAQAIPSLSLVLVGPNSLEAASQRRLEALPNVHLLGPRPYRDAPGYLQHADVVIVPHRVSAFSETLDPIKAYECLAIDRPTVATPVAGFREHEGALIIAPSEVFTGRVSEVLEGSLTMTARRQPEGWKERASAFEEALKRCVGTDRRRSPRLHATSSTR